LRIKLILVSINILCKVIVKTRYRKKWLVKQQEEIPNGKIKHTELFTDDADQLTKSPFVKDYTILKVADDYSHTNSDIG